MATIIDKSLLKRDHRQRKEVDAYPDGSHGHNYKSNTIANPFSVYGQPIISVVIPALNEADNLPFVLPNIPCWVNEIILVDGHSTDLTVEVAKQLRSEIKVLTQEGRGKGSALRQGFLASSGDIIIMLDADGSTDPAEIPVFVGALLAGADFVKGSRFLQGGGTLDMPLYRRLGNWALTVLTNFLFGTHYTDITYGFNATWRYCAPGLALEINGWANEIISNIRMAHSGLHVVEVACFEYKRVAGQAKLKTFSAGWAILKEILKERLIHRNKWEIWDNRRIVGDNVFTPAMRLLRDETLDLLNDHEQLSPEAYERGLEAIRGTFLQLLQVYTPCPDARRLQEQYTRDSRRFLMHFADIGQANHRNRTSRP